MKTVKVPYYDEPSKPDVYFGKIPVSTLPESGHINVPEEEWANYLNLRTEFQQLHERLMARIKYSKPKKGATHGRPGIDTSGIIKA